MIWRNGWTEEQTLGGMDASEKLRIFQFRPHQTFLLIILVAKKLVWQGFESISSHKQQRRPVPSLLSSSMLPIFLGVLVSWAGNFSVLTLVTGHRRAWRFFAGIALVLLFLNFLHTKHDFHSTPEKFTFLRTKKSFFTHKMLPLSGLYKGTHIM